MTVGGTIGTKDYCNAVYTEMSEMKSRIFDIMCKVEKLPEEQKNRLKPQYSDFFELVDFIEEKLSSLTRECPTEWSTEREEIEERKAQLTEKINYWDAEHIPGGYVGG